MIIKLQMCIYIYTFIYIYIYKCIYGLVQSLGLLHAVACWLVPSVFAVCSQSMSCSDGSASGSVQPHLTSFPDVLSLLQGQAIPVMFLGNYTP